MPGTDIGPCVAVCQPVHTSVIYCRHLPVICTLAFTEPLQYFGSVREKDMSIWKVMNVFPELDTNQYLAITLKTKWD